MNKKLMVFVLLLGFTAYASAAIVELPDSVLLTMGVGGSEDATLDAITDIPGDPGVQFDFTFAPGAGWKDIAILKYYPTSVGIGDTFTAKVKNVSLDGNYITVYPIFQVDGWVYHQGTGFNVAYGAEAILTMANPATTSIESVGFKVGTNDWMGREDGGSAAMQVIPIIPEPATLALLGLGGLLMRRKRS